VQSVNVSDDLQPEPEIVSLAAAAPLPALVEADDTAGHAKAARVKGATLAAYAKVYGVGSRQASRWNVLGLQNSDPCPFGSPELMPAWWDRNMENRCPHRIILAARAAVGIGELPAGVGPHCGVEPPPPLSIEPPPSIDLKTLDMAEGEPVRQARRLAQAAYNRLEHALFHNSGSLASCQREYQLCAEMLRKSEIADREAQRLRGLLIPRGEVERDYTALAGMLRQMRESMVRRVLERCPALEPAQRAEVAAAVEHVRSQEDRIFRRTAPLTSNEDLLEALAG
jgi:hypothetical protein